MINTQDEPAATSGSDSPYVSIFESVGITDGLGLALIAVISACAGFLLEFILTRAKIRQLKSDADAKRIEAVKTVLEYEEQLAKLVEDASDCMLPVADAVRGDQIDGSLLKSKHNEACALISGKVLLKLCAHTELRMELSRNDTDRAAIIEEELIPSINKYGNWLRVLNHEKILTLVNSPPLPISSDTGRRIQRILQRIENANIRNRCETKLGLAIAKAKPEDT